MAGNPPLPFGRSPLGPGQIAAVVTFLEMTAPREEGTAETAEADIKLAPLGVDIAAYRALFHRVGADWLWASRARTGDAALHAILADQRVEAFAAQRAGDTIGMLELDFRRDGECEIVFFGLVREAIGRGLGRQLMRIAQARAWARPIRRLWLHTCTLDHQAAAAFYQRAGFRPYAMAVQVFDDPRLTGHLPRDAAPHVALIGRAAPEA